MPTPQIRSNSIMAGRAATLAMAGALALSACASTAFADQACKHVKLHVTNQLEASRAITVLAVSYYDVEDHKWRTSKLANDTVEIGRDKYLAPEVLEYVGNEPIERMRLKIKVWPVDGHGPANRASWTNTVEFPSDNVCYSHKGYAIVVNSAGN